MRISPVVQSLTEPLLSPLVSAITGVIGGGFNPQQFFQDGSIGVLYDNNDLTTMFLDAAGTTPATVNGLVGLQLDKSQGLVLGAELVTNGDFSNGSTGWFVRPNWAVSGGSATATGASDSFQQVATPYTAGKWYKVEFDWTHTGGTLFVRLGTGPAATFTTSGRKIVYLLAANTAGIEFYGGTASGTLDNISVKEIAGNHRYQTTTASKPVLRGTPTGANLITNGTFDTDTAWTKTGSSTISGGKGNLDGNAAAGILAQSGVLTNGKVYRVRFDISSITGTLKVWNDIGSTLASFTTTGTKEFYFTHTIANSNFVFRVDLGANTASVDNVDIRDVSAGSVTAPYGLQYDGVDDFLQTASVNFSATDKMFVCAGVRKLSDAAVGMLVEFSDNWNTNNGAFNIQAPPLAGQDRYYFGAKGTVQANASVTSGYAAPITNVVTGIANISGDSTRLRINGALDQTSPSDLGTGNFGNYALYFGRRGGTTLPFNGLDFGFCIVGKTLAAPQIANTERWMAQRTGVTL